MYALSVQQLVKTYDNGTAALTGISFDVKQGDFFALLGQNGAGKSTTIGIISSLVKKTSGHVAIFGHDVDHQVIEAKSLLGIVPQELNLSLFEKVSNILRYQAGYYGISAKIAAPRIERYLKAMNLWEMRDKPAIYLSGGMKRRLMIARSLINEPKLLILDEPTAGVDVELRYLLWEFLTELNQAGTTIILTTHYLEEAERLCRNVAIIDHGAIIVNTEMKSLINQLHRQTFVLDIAGQLPTTVDLHPFAHKVIDAHTLEVEIPRQENINDLFSLLSKNNIVASGMRNKSGRLEELFINLVGANKRSQ